MLIPEAAVSVESSDIEKTAITPRDETQETHLESSGEFKNLNKRQIDLLKTFADLSC